MYLHGLLLIYRPRRDGRLSWRHLHLSPSCDEGSAFAACVWLGWCAERCCKCRCGKTGCSRWLTYTHAAMRNSRWRSWWWPYSACCYTTPSSSSTEAGVSGLTLSPFCTRRLVCLLLLLLCFSKVIDLFPNLFICAKQQIKMVLNIHT